MNLQKQGMSGIFLLLKNLIVPYNPEWKREFDKLSTVLRARLKDFEIDIQHVGSTSVPGLHAKPILDIDIIIDDKRALDLISEILASMGYIGRGDQGVSGRFAFRQLSPRTPLEAGVKKWQEHHLYVCFSDSLALKNHIKFRDSLLKNVDLVKQYSELKTDLVNQKGMTREQYTFQKTAFILSVLTGSGLTENELNEIRNANTGI
jgi:GrpB-like predicted nucleotidyltransferase (UPF0157 family)